MLDETDRSLRRYELFREQITRASASLFETYRDHLTCRRGCSFCCEPIAVIPVERQAISQWMRANAYKPSHQTQPGRCACLQADGACGIYAARPIICRTFGLPLSYRTYEYDIHGREVIYDPPEQTDLWCDLNFTSIAPNQMTDFFSRHGRLRMSAINERLEKINDDFLAAGTFSGATEARPLSEIPQFRTLPRR